MFWKGVSLKIKMFFRHKKNLTSSHESVKVSKCQSVIFRFFLIKQYLTGYQARCDVTLDLLGVTG